MRDDDITFKYRGKTLRYLFEWESGESEEAEESAEGSLGDVEIQGFVIAGKFFRLGRKVASPEKCRRCGKCCLTVGEIQALPSDIERWISQGREEILSRLEVEERDRELVTFGRLKLGDSTKRCVFLQKDGEGYKCAIHNTKPEVCLEYPLNVGGICKAGIDFRD